MNDLIDRHAAIDAVIKRDANCGIDSAEVLRALPSAQLCSEEGLMNDDAISRQAVLKLLYALPPEEATTKAMLIQNVKQMDAAQSEQDREFMKLTVKNSNGRPYYSIISLEFDDNGIGHDFEGYSSYSLDVISDYLKKYFMPSVQPSATDTNVGGNMIDRQAAIDAAPRAIQGGIMIRMGVCHRDKTLCVDCDSEDCVLAGDIESDCPAWVCQQPEKECKDCELLKEYVDKWRREHDTYH